MLTHIPRQIGYQDTINSNNNVQTQLDNAYNVASGTDFKLFISFDYLAQGAWDQNAVVKTIQGYSSYPAQFMWDGKPLASTFEGPGNAGDWAYIKAQTGCFFVPDYSSLGAATAAATPNIDGLFSWNAWPNGPANMTASDDQFYMSQLGDKPFMMPVSPWFYTNLPAWNKNWLWYSDHLWDHRWQQVAQIKPAMVEIISWNDWGESHYISPLPSSTSAMPPGSAVYVQGNPHDAWLKDLPHYIALYKGTPRPSEAHITFWYRPNPSNSGSTAGTMCNTPTQGQEALPAQECVTDAVFFTAFVPDHVTATVNVTIGGSSLSATATSPGIFHSSLPFNDLGDGTVLVSVSGSDGSEIGPVEGVKITTDCVDGNVNWNAWVGGS
jgi:hypothetical protein